MSTNNTQPEQHQQHQQHQHSHQQSNLTFKQATAILREFVGQRQWEKYHTPRNLVLALMGEVGQIAQIFQWKGQVQNGLVGFKEQEKVHVGEEIADVLNYLIRLADVCNIDIETAFRDKMSKIRKKYPQDQIKADANYFFEVKQKRRINRQGTSEQKKEVANQNKQAQSSQKIQRTGKESS